MAWAASVQRQGEAQRGDLSGLPTETHDVHFELTSEQQWLRCKCRALAADFATRSAAHDRDASHPVENYQRLREEGFLALTIGKEWGGQGASLLDLAGISTGVARCFGAGVTSTVS